MDAPHHARSGSIYRQCFCNFDIRRREATLGFVCSPSGRKFFYETLEESLSRKDTIFCRWGIWRDNNEAALPSGAFQLSFVPAGNDEVFQEWDPLLPPVQPYFISMAVWRSYAWHLGAEKYGVRCRLRYEEDDERRRSETRGPTPGICSYEFTSRYRVRDDA